MRTLAFDGRMGASGDMILAAMIAAGADPAVLAPVEEALDVHYAVEKTTKNDIAATRVRVVLDDADREVDQASNDGDHPHSHAHGHDHDIGGQGNNRDHDHDRDGDDHDHGHSGEAGTPAEGHGPHRSYEEVLGVVEAMDLPGDVEADARAVFELLGRAEAAVHGTDLSATHFHEVGADDAIADVVGAALLIDDLGVERVVTTPLAAGGGEVSMSHGTYPVPVPAVVEIAERADWTLRGGPVDAELLTPTGAAVLGHYADGVEALPPLSVAASGYGAGGYDFPEHPNVLRALVGESRGRLAREDITVLETNLDDASPEVLGDLQASLSEAGARDVSILPATMKKSRPGHLLKVIAKPEDSHRVARRLAAETGTLGVRETGTTHRWIARRRIESATIPVDGREYEVGVKVASDEEGAILDVSAEYDDAAGVARETERPVRSILELAERAVRDDLLDRSFESE